MKTLHILLDFKALPEKNLTLPTLVYPDKGMYVLLGDDGKVNHIGFMYKCGD